MYRQILFLVLFFHMGAEVFATDCPDGWTAYEGSCYLFGHNEKLTFTGAENYCRQHNGHLVRIDTSAENNFMKSFMSGLKTDTFWIGLTDDIVENEWKWVASGTRPTFTGWAPNEPNNGGGIEDCAVFLYGTFKWNDVPCTHSNEPICEIRVDETQVVVFMPTSASR